MEDEITNECSGQCHECEHSSYCDCSLDTYTHQQKIFERNTTRKIYLASSLQTEYRADMYEILSKLRRLGHQVYAPVEHKVPDAWSYSNEEWGRLVFLNDIKAITSADIVVAISYGRIKTTAGSSWEIGYAFGIGKKVIVVEMDEGPQSLMVSNGSHATVSGIEGIMNYDFNLLPKTMTKSEQK